MLKATKAAERQQKQRSSQVRKATAATGAAEGPSASVPLDKPVLLPARLTVSALPQHPRMPTLARIPRGLARRYARLRSLTLEWLLDACDAGLPEDVCETWSTLARLLPWLILHDDRDPDATQATRVVEGGESPAGARRRVVDRLHMAEQGQWHGLISAAIAAEAHYEQRTRASKPTSTIPARQLFARIVKHALTGSLRAAKRLLLGA